MVGLWAWSSKDLLIRFKQSVGRFDNDAIQSFVITNDSINRGIVKNNTPTPEQYKPGESENPATLDDEVIQGEDSFTEQPESNILPTYTPYPTYTPFPKLERLKIDPTPTPEFVYDPAEFDYINSLIEINYSGRDPDQVLDAKYSWYYPPYGGINCDTVNGVEECNYMANGQLAHEYMGVAWACPPDIPFESRIYIRELDQWGVCKDRGSMIRLDPSDDRYWFDHLMKDPLLWWGCPVTIEVYYEY